MQISLLAGPLAVAIAMASSVAARGAQSNPDEDGPAPWGVPEASRAAADDLPNVKGGYLVSRRSTDGMAEAGGVGMSRRFGHAQIWRRVPSQPHHLRNMMRPSVAHWRAGWLL